jgi:phosphatidylethanolamine-binding protein (PEBP) family uncharacterized protein
MEDKGMHSGYFSAKNKKISKKLRAGLAFFHWVVYNITKAFGGTAAGGSREERGGLRCLTGYSRG